MAIEKVVNLKVTDNVDKTTKSVSNLKTQLREAQNEVNELSAKFGATSREAVEAAKRASDLKDAIGDAKALTDAFNPDAKFKALTSTLGGVAGGFAAVQGAVGLLGTESQDVEKMILKVQSAMAITQGIQAVGESVDNFKQLLAVVKDNLFYQKALAAAIAIQTFVMNGATLAAKALRGALVATGIGALVVGIGLLVANFDKLKSIIFSSANNVKVLNDKLKETIAINDDLISQDERRLTLLEAQGANEEKIFATKQQNLTKEIARILEKMDATEAVYKAELEAGDLTNERKKELEDEYDAFKKQAVEKRAEFEINKNAQVVKEVNDALNDQIKRDDEIQASKDKKEEKAKERREKANEEAKRLREEAYEHERLFVEQQLTDSKDSIDKKREIVIADMDLSKKDRQKFLYDLHLEEQKSEQEHAEKLKDINKRYDEEKENRLADTNVKKEELDYQRRKLEIESIAQTESEKLNLIAKLNEEHNAKMIDAKKADADKQLEIEQAVAAAKLAIQNSQLDNISNGIAVIQNLGIKSKALQKGLMIAESAAGIAKIVINTQAANSAAALKYALLPGGQALAAAEITANKVGAGIGIAANLVSTSKALSALGGGGSAGGGSQGTGGSAPTPPQFNIVGQSGTNQLAQTIAGQQNKPIEAFVVSSAVTSSQALDRNRVRTATFGG
jgi:membrane protein involved in colicin uptake